MAAISQSLAQIQPFLLSEVLSLQNDPYIKRIQMSFIKANDLADVLPVATYNTFVTNGSRQLGGHSMDVFRYLNSPGTWQPITPQEWKENIYLIGQPINLDVEAEGLDTEISDIWKKNIDDVSQGIAYARSNEFINNSPIAGQSQSNDLKGVLGLFPRSIAKDPATGAGNSIEYGISPQLIFDAATNLSKTNWSSAAGTDWTSTIDATIDRMGLEDGNGLVCCHNTPFMTALNSSFRLESGSGGFSTYQDQYQRTIKTYNGMKFRNLMRLPADVNGNQSGYIIPITESADGSYNAATGAGKTFTSTWVLRPGMDHVHLWQKSPMRRMPKTLLPGGAQWQITINWSMGIVLEDTLSVARQYDINVAGVPS